MRPGSFAGLTTCSDAMRLCTDRGTTITVAGNRPQAGEVTAAVVAISGRLVPVP